MATEKRLIDANEALERFNQTDSLYHFAEWYTRDDTVRNIFDNAPTVDAVEVVRCEKCVHCVNDEEEPGMCKCVESAEYDSESGLWLGFVEYHTPDFFCAFGERKDNG